MTTMRGVVRGKQGVVLSKRDDVRAEQPPDLHQVAYAIARQMGFPRVRLGRQRAEWVAAGEEAWGRFSRNASIDAVAEVLMEFDRLMVEGLTAAVHSRRRGRSDITRVRGG